ncbi:MAG: DUF892 family protein [Rubricoccaceae bacterium]|nr:DUF892 family protein [Rubricoccaceae bacterium]
MKDQLKDLYIEQLRDLYNAEGQIVQNAPKMAEAAQNDDLRQACETHAQRAEQRRGRIAEIVEAHGEKASGVECKAMTGLMNEAKEHVLDANLNEDVQDAALIAQLQRVLHYELAGFGTVNTWSGSLDADRQSFFQSVLDETYEADRMLTDLATRTVNQEAMA